MKGMDFEFVTTEQVNEEKKKLVRRFREAPAVEGIRSFHAAIPQSRKELLLKSLSQASEGITFHFSGADLVCLEESTDVFQGPVTR